MWANGIFALPSPTDSTRSQLARWLVSKNVELEPPHVRLQLIDRLQSEFLGGWNPAPSRLPLTASQHSQLNANIRELKYQWFTARCYQFEALSTEERDAFLDAQIAFISKLQTLPAESSSESFFEEIDRWRKRTHETQRPAVDQAISAAVLRWLQTEPIGSMEAPQIATLADRIAVQLDKGLDTSARSTHRLPSDRSDIWRANVDTLMRAWFQSQANACDRLPKAQRAEFVTDTVKRVSGWKLEKILSSTPKHDKNGNGADLIGHLATRIDTWIATSSDNDAARLRHFKNQIHRAVLAEFLRKGRAFFR